MGTDFYGAPGVDVTSLADNLRINGIVETCLVSPASCIGDIRNREFVLADKSGKLYPSSDVLGTYGFSKSGSLFLSFLLRVIGMVPMDVSSMYLGSTGVPFLPYLLATTAGALPKVVAITLAGDSITEPGSPAFLLSAAFTAGLTVLSSLFYLWYRKRHYDAEKN